MPHITYFPSPRLASITLDCLLPYQHHHTATDITKNQEPSPSARIPVSKGLGHMS